MDIRLNETDLKVRDYLTSIGCSFEATGGHLSKRGEWDCFAWRVTFKRGRSAPARSPSDPLPRLEADYFTGTGHVTQPKFRDGTPLGIPVPVPPSSATVLSSLLLDASAADQCFNDWCADYGSSNDSIAAFNTYQKCCEIGAKLRKFFTHEERCTLADMLQDY